MLKLFIFSHFCSDRIEHNDFYITQNIHNLTNKNYEFKFYDHLNFPGYKLDFDSLKIDIKNTKTDSNIHENEHEITFIECKKKDWLHFNAKRHNFIFIISIIDLITHEKANRLKETLKILTNDSKINS